MLDNTFAPSKFNRFIHLGEIEDRIIYYLLSPNKKTKEEREQTEIIWKLLYYNDTDALNRELPTYEQVANLVCNDDITQTDKKIFRSPHFEDAWLTETALLKIYVEQIVPVDRYKAVVNIGIDVISHNKCINIFAPEDENSPPIDTVNGVDIRISTRSRVTTLVEAVLHLLNGAHVEGVGNLEFSQEMSRFQQAQYGIWNNRNFEGIKIVLGCYMSGVS